MRLRLEQLSSHLHKLPAPIYLVSGNEAVLMEEALTQITLAAKQQGFNETFSLPIDTHFDWENWLLSTNTRSLFSTKQLRILYFNTIKIGDKGSAALQHYIKQQNDESMLIIFCPKLDASTLKTKWCQAIDTVGIILQIWPLDKKAHQNWFLSKLKPANLTIAPLAAEWLVEQTSGNLLATRQAIEQLKLLFEAGSHIQLAELQAIFHDQGEFNVFDLVDACNTGNIKNCLRILRKLQATGIESILMLWALTRELRMLHEIQIKMETQSSLDQVLRDAHILPARKQTILLALKRLKQSDIYRLLEEASHLDATIKGGTTMVLESSLEKWCLSYCGAL